MALVSLDNKKQIILIGVAVVIGIVACVLAAGYITTTVNEETTKLAVTYEKAQKQKEQQYNEQLALLNQKIKDVEVSATKAAQDAAKVAAENVRPKVVATEGPKRKGSLALKTPSGKRAITVMLESLGAVGGLINPGDFVDVIAHLNVPVPTKSKKDSAEEVTAMIFQNLQILAINTNIDESGLYDDQQKLTALKVTFAVDPQEAGLLAFAEKNGKLELALRSPNEKERKMLSSATWSALSEYVLENNGAQIKTPETVPVQSSEVKKPQAPTIQIYKGGKEQGE